MREKMAMDNQFSCQPPSGKTYLTIGQDLFSIQDYIMTQYNASLHRSDDSRDLLVDEFKPAAAMVYTDIQSLHGLDEPTDYGTGIEYADGILQLVSKQKRQPEANNSNNNHHHPIHFKPLPSTNVGLQIGLFLNGTAGCRDIISGQLDHKLFQLMDYLFHVSSPKVFLRIGYEFDNPSFGFSDDPHAYRQAFRTIVVFCQDYFKTRTANTTVTTTCRDKVAFVWHSWGAKRIAKLEQFYPGNIFVDWIGISIFQQFYPWSTSNGIYSGGTMEQVYDVLNFAKDKDHNKPIMIAESAPFGGVFLDDLMDNNGKQYMMKHYPRQYEQRSKNQTDSVDEIIWNTLWFQPVLDLIEKFDIGMWSYIHCDWNAQPMWKGVGFGDTRISASNLIMEQWYKQVLTNPRFVNRLECDWTNQSSGDVQSRTILSDASMKTTEIASSTPSSSHFVPMVVQILLVLTVFGTVASQRRWGSQNRKLSRRSVAQERKLVIPDSDDLLSDPENKPISRSDYGSTKQNDVSKQTKRNITDSERSRSS